MHVLTCKSREKWVVLLRENPASWSVAFTGNVLRQAVERSFAHGFDHALTYSERQADEVLADLAEEPDQLAGVSRAVDLCILAPERRWPADDRWASLLKSTGRTDLWAPGGGFAGFRQQVPYAAVLKDKILVDFFGFGSERLDATWRTFVGSQKGVSRPHYSRELYVRPRWNARQFAPDSLPEYRAGPVLSEAQQAKLVSKLGQTKSTIKRAKRAANLERFRKEAAERAALREQAQ